MTGGAGGYCLLKVPGAPGEVIVGLAGREGKPVTMASFSSREKALAHLKRQAVLIENALKHVHHRIDELEAGRAAHNAVSRE
jgi:hypothetical protein